MSVVNVQLRQKVTNEFSKLIYLETSVGQVVGLLNESEKLSDALMPDYVFGGPKYINVFDPGTTSALALTAIKDGETLEDDNLQLKGRYLIANVNGALTISTNHEVYAAEGLGKLTSGTVTLQNGDRLIYKGKYETKLVWGIQNNTYPDASTTIKGVVKLAGTGSAVTVSKSDHNHDATYAPLTHSHDYDDYGNWVLKTGATEENIDSGDKVEFHGGDNVTITHSSITGGRRIAIAASQPDVPAFATLAQAKAGTNSTTIMSPERVKESIDWRNSLPLFGTLALANAAQEDYIDGKFVLVVSS